MSRILVSKHGMEVGQLQLVDGQEYLVGRGDTCDFVLESYKGLSRQHLKFYQGDDGTWAVQLVSRYGGLLFDGNPVEQINLDADTTFVVSPYEFKFELIDMPSAVSEVSAPMDQSDFNTNPSMMTREPSFDSAADTPPPDVFEDTIAGVRTEVAYLRVKTTSSEVEEIFRLDGESWIAGRDESCEICLNHLNISRQHFEIYYEDSQYFIKDLGSSNGTIVNGKAVSSDAPVKLESNDIISIKNIMITFEIRNPRFDNMLQTIPQEMMQFEQQMPGSQPLPAAVRMPPGGDYGLTPSLPAKMSRNTMIRIGLGALAVIIVVVGLMDDEKPSGEKDGGSEKPKLTEQQIAEVKHLLNLAQSSYESQSFALCVSNLDRLHEISGSYLNSRDLLKTCQQAILIQSEQEEIARQQELQLQQQQRLQTVIQGCSSRMQSFNDVAEFDSCVLEVTSLDPENAEVARLRQELEQKFSQIEASKQNQLHRSRLKQQGISVFNKAKGYEQNKDYKKAIATFNQYLTAQYPDQGPRENEARRSLASVEREFETLVKQAIHDCRALIDEKKFKEAYFSCVKAQEVDRNNPDIENLKTKANNELNKHLRVLYQDASLEESMGHIEKAKVLYNQILDQSIPSKDIRSFHQRAKTKLRRINGDT